MFVCVRLQPIGPGAWLVIRAGVWVRERARMCVCMCVRVRVQLWAWCVISRLQEAGASSPRTWDTIPGMLRRQWTRAWWLNKKSAVEQGLFYLAPGRDRTCEAKALQKGLQQGPDLYLEPKWLR